MSQTPIDRLRDYLGQLPPASQALLMREFERAIERGQDVAVATVVLDQLRRVARKTEDEEETPSAPPPRTEDIARFLFQPIEPFLVDGNVPMRPGQIRRTSLTPIWQWLIRDGATDAVYEFEKALAGSARWPAAGGGAAQAAGCRGRRHFPGDLADQRRRSANAGAHRGAERDRGFGADRRGAAGARGDGWAFRPLADDDTQFRGRARRNLDRSPELAGACRRRNCCRSRCRC